MEVRRGWVPQAKCVHLGKVFPLLLSLPAPALCSSAPSRVSSARAHTVPPPKLCYSKGQQIINFLLRDLTDVFFTLPTKSNLAVAGCPTRTPLTCDPQGSPPVLPSLLLTLTVSTAPPFPVPEPDPRQGQHSQVPRCTGLQATCVRSGKWGKVRARSFPGTDPGQGHNLQQGKSWLEKGKFLLAEGEEALDAPSLDSPSSSRSKP